MTTKDESKKMDKALEGVTILDFSHLLQGPFATQLLARLGADIIKVDGKSYMFPLASFVYPVFVNLDMAKAAGVDKLPSTRSEFADAANRLRIDG